MKDRELFLHAAEGVTPLKYEARADTGRPPPRKKRENLQEDVRTDYLSDSVPFPEDETSFCRPGLSQALRKLKRGKLAAEAQLDLHGLRREEARAALLAFLDACQGCKVVRIVHGKGYGSSAGPILKGLMKSYLMQIPEVLAFSEARPSEGGSGALVVLLKTH